jgi:plasmid stability protein
MASLTIRKLDDTLKKRLRLQAARHGRSMEEEARRILQAGVRSGKPSVDNVADAIRRIVDPIGGIELEPLPRDTLRDIPRFDDENEH